MFLVIIRLFRVVVESFDRICDKKSIDKPLLVLVVDKIGVLCAGCFEDKQIGDFKASKLTGG